MRKILLLACFLSLVFLTTACENKKETKKETDVPRNAFDALKKTKEIKAKVDISNKEKEDILENL